MYKHIVEVNSEFYDFPLELSDGGVEEVFCDTETTSLDPFTSRFLLFQVMVKDVVYIYDFTRLPIESLKYIISILNQSKVKCIFFNAKFDIKHLYHNTGIWLDNVFDIMNCEVLLNAGIGKSLYSLEDTALKYTGVKLDKSVRTLFQNAGAIDESMLRYAAEDVRILKLIYHKQLELIAKAKEEQVLQLEMNLLTPVAKMEYDGVLLDKELWESLAKRSKERQDHSEKELHDLLLGSVDFAKFSSALDALDCFGINDSLRVNSSGKRLPFNKAERQALSTIKGVNNIKEIVSTHINFGSSSQLLKLLNYLGVPIENTNEKTMRKFYNEYEYIQKILDFREASKSNTTYGLNFLHHIHPVTNRIHTEFLNMGAATGRFSSTNPNLQNIPSSSDYRRSFIPTPGWKWLSLDYSQQEYRLSGGISGEPKIIDAYVRGADMHTATAAILFNKKIDEVTKEERSKGKAVNFAILYGSSEYGLKYNLGISLDEARNIINSFNTGYPVLYAFKQAAEEAIVNLGYSTTPLGRRRYNLPKPLYMNNFEYLKYIARIKREGFNHIIQGGGADIVKIAMVNIYRNNPFGDKFRMLIQIHDEINAEAHESIAEDAAQFMKEEMLKAEQMFLGDVPAAVDVKVANHWVH